MKKKEYATLAICICLLGSQVWGQRSLAANPSESSLIENELSDGQVSQQKQTHETKGIGAGKIYHIPQGVSIGGYGHMDFNVYAPEMEDGEKSGKTNQIDTYRNVLYFGYKYNENFVFNSEIEIEHTNEIFLEFSYIDYLINDLFNFRSGLLLVPMGFLNELHEPPIFLGVKRTQTETYLIPSTWRENGVGFHGAWENLSYQIYLVNGFNGENFGNSNPGLRDGRQKGAKAEAKRASFTGRLDYLIIPSTLIGVSGFTGGQNQGTLMEVENPEEQVSSALPLYMGDIHFQFRQSGLHIRGLASYASLDYNPQKDHIGTKKTVGSAMIGYYLEVGYDVFTRLNMDQKLIPFIRFEKLDTTYKVPSGLKRDPAQNRTIISTGLNYLPIPQVVFKMDAMFNYNDAKTGVNQLNFQVGYLF